MITVKGIALKDVNLKPEGDGVKVTGNYCLMSSIDVVLAKQSFNGYSDLEVNLSGKTMKALKEFRVSLEKDIEAVLGLDIEETK